MPFTYDQIYFAHQMILREMDPTLNEKSIIDSIFGDGALKWFSSESAVRKAKEKELKEFQLSKQIQEKLKEEFGETTTIGQIT